MSFHLCPSTSETCDCQSLTTPYNYLSLIVPPDISISIYQPYLVSSKKSPQEVSIDVIKIVKNVKLGGVSDEPALYFVEIKMNC